MAKTLFIKGDLRLKGIIFCLNKLATRKRPHAYLCALEKGISTSGRNLPLSVAIIEAGGLP